MKKLFGFLRKRWVLSLLGVIALSLLILFGAQYLAIGGYQPWASWLARGLTVFIVFLIWGLWQLWARLRAAKREKQMTDDLVANAQGPGMGDEEVAILGEGFQKGLETLRKASGKRRGGQYLYELPWYVIIGPPGAGKTTALVNSGLKFPLADEEGGARALAGTGGTRNCDWWFTDQAVLLDTAGRYSTQDSDSEVDRQAWSGFLDLLKRYRPRRPINGIILAVSLSELMQLSPAEREQHQHALRSRLNELYEYLGVRFPVYVMFTKCDLLSGFTEFFDDLDSRERAQAWGFTLSHKEPLAKEFADRFEKEFDLLLERLYPRLFQRMHTERDLSRRGRVFNVPRQLGSIKELLSTFLGELFQPSRFHATPMVRGVYFTSGTQEGTPIDRLMTSVAQEAAFMSAATAGLSGQGRSYFLKDLFTDVIFHEQGLAGTDPRVERRRRWLQWGAYTAAAGLLAFVTTGWYLNYQFNAERAAQVRTYLDRSAQAARDARTQEQSFFNVLPILNPLRQATEVYDAEEPCSPSPKSSTPQLFEAMVRSFVPASRIAAIRFSGMPQRPKPPAAIVMPSNRRPSSASAADP